MGTERDLVYEGKCACGKGKFILYCLTPDHPWAKSYDCTYETAIECSNCRKKYELEIRGNSVCLVLKTDLAKKEQLSKEWHRKSEEILKYAAHHGYLAALEKKLGSLPSVAAIYRALKPLMQIDNSENTFRKHFRASANIMDWIKRNVRPGDLPQILKWLNIKDDKLNKDVVDASHLWNLSQKAVSTVGTAIYTI